MEVAIGRKFHVESEFAVKINEFQGPEAKTSEKLPPKTNRKNKNDFFFFILLNLITGLHDWLVFVSDRTS